MSTTRTSHAGRMTHGSWYTRRGLFGWAMVAYLITFVIVLPLLWVVVLSFRPSDSILNNPTALGPFTTGNYSRAIQTLPLIRMYASTLILALTSVIVGTVISLMSSYALSRIVLRHRKLLTTVRIYLLAGLTIPVFILLFPVYRVDIALGIFGSYLGLILPYIAVTLPFNTLLFTGFLADFPTEIEDAAIVDGVSLTRMLTSVVIPLMRPVIVTVLIFNVIFVFNEYPFVSILGSADHINTISLAIGQFQGQFSTDYGAMMSAATIIIIPQIVIYAILQKQVIAGITGGAVKG